MYPKMNLIFSLSISTIIALILLTAISIKGAAEPSIDLLTALTGTPTLSNDQSIINPSNQARQSSPTPPSGGGFEASSTPDPLMTYTIILTDTPTSTATSTYTPSPTPQPISFSVLPLINRVNAIPIFTPSPLETVLFCDDLDQPLNIPDNDTSGIDTSISIDENQLLIDLSLYLDITHSAVGDLVIKLTNPISSKTITVLDLPGNQSYRCAENDIVTILDDGAAQPGNEQCSPESPAISGIYLPSQNLSELTHIIPTGSWRLNVSDRDDSNLGKLNHWCLIAKMSNMLPTPTPNPTPVNLPSSASVSGMSGQSQYFNLDCESRSAVDWANHFGVNINELEFFYNLPDSDDDPEIGFVGAVNGQWGNIPPDDYGVHAPPIADLLHDYGLTASSFRSLHWDDVRAEIASGNPVIVWIIGDYSLNLVNGIPHLYTPLSTGNTTIVAPYEHTVIVVGYTPDHVTILNGSHFLNIPLDQFLDSWSVLQFQGVIARP